MLPSKPGILLSLNTCGSLSTIALGSILGGVPALKVLASATLAARTNAAQLIPEIAALLESRGLTVRDLVAIVVVNGPGSFTGVRVGVSTAKGLAEGCGVPLIAVSRLALLAYASGLPHVLAAVDAGRGEYFVGEYRNGQRLSEMLLSGDETISAANRAGAGVLVCDEGNDEDASASTPAVRSSACAALAVCGPIYVQPPDAAEALRFAVPRFQAGLFDDLALLEANYLRRSDAEMLMAAKAELSTFP